LLRASIKKARAAGMKGPFPTRISGAADLLAAIKIFAAELGIDPNTGRVLPPAPPAANDQTSIPADVRAGFIAYATAIGVDPSSVLKGYALMAAAAAPAPAPAPAAPEPTVDEAAKREAQIEREQIESVFGLGGGELNSDPWVVKADDREISYLYNYDGPPEYADFDDRHDRDYVTVVTQALYSPIEPILTSADGSIYRLRADYSSSGETECCYRSGAPEDAIVKAEQAHNGECPYCATPVGEAHGHIYIGDGWIEAVYRRDRTPAELAEAHNIECWEDRVWDLSCGKCGDTSAHDGYVDANGAICPECSKECSATDTGKDAWFYWTCLPGCLPEGDANGPYDTEAEALAAATEGLEDDDV
jgi:hypothetical protein